MRASINRVDERGDRLLIDFKYISKAKEKLGNKMAFIIAEELGIEDFDEKNMKSCCPFHQEDTPSFIWNEKSLNFHCFGACGRSYDILDVFMSKGMTYMQAVQKLFDLADIQYPLGEVGVKTRSQYRYPKPEYADSKDRVYAYWGKRGISKETIDYLNIQQDKNGNALFQYYDTNDVLTMCKVRPSKRVPHGETKTWCLPNSDTTPILYNMNRINTDSPLLIATGEGDCAAAIEAGFRNAVSIPLGDGNTHWIEECWEWLEQFPEIIVAHDNDESGMKYLKAVIPRLGSWRCKVMSIPSVVEVSGKQYHIKDINEYLFRCGKQAVLEAVLNAKDSPIKSVTDVTEIKNRDYSDVDGITIGLTEIDEMFMRFFFGSFNIISGTPGSGKTSIINQFVSQALDQDCDCWLFSRELPDWTVKSWLYHVLAGRRNLNEYTDKKGKKYYKVKPLASQMIDEHYKGRMFVYNDDEPNDVDSIKRSMEDSARKYGAKLFIIDNLMMVDLDINENNANQKQTDFVNWLINFSKKYQVLTVLVCHPNKTQNCSEGIGLYNISGSSHIVNLAHRAIGLRRVSKKEREGSSKFSQYNVVVNVMKDRFTGMVDNEIGLFYDVPSQRFFSDYKEYSHQYKWDGTNYTEPLPIPKCLIDNTDEVFGEIKG